MITATTTCSTIDATTTQCATITSQQFVGGFSYGEFMQIFLLILIFAVVFFAELRKYVEKKRFEVRIIKDYIK